MKVKAVLVNIKYRENFKTKKKSYNIEEKIDRIKIFDTVKDDEICLDTNNELVIRNHMKEDGGFQRLAFKLELEKEEKLEEIHIRSRVGEEEVARLSYMPTYNIFFDDTKGSCNAINTAGIYFIDIFKNAILIKTLKINVIPSAFSYNDYIQMLQEIRDFRESLIESENSKIGLYKKKGFFESDERRIDFISEKINSLSKFLKCIELEPKQSLKAKLGKVKRIKIKKVNSNFMREFCKFPYKKEYNIEIVEKTKNIYEHRAIYSALCELENDLDFYKKRYYQKVRTKEIEIKKIRHEYEKITNGSIPESIKGYKSDIDSIDKKFNDLLLKKVQNKKGYENIIRVRKFGRWWIKNINLHMNKQFEVLINLSEHKETKKKYATFDRKLSYGAFEALDSRIQAIKFQSSDLNEIMFLCEELKNQSKVNLINGQTEDIKQVTFISFNKIVAIDNKSVPTYTKEEQIEFIYRYLPSINGKFINIKKTREELGLAKSIMLKEEKVFKSKVKLELGHEGIEQSKKVLKKLKGLEVFKDIPKQVYTPLKLTQIFTNDIKYRNVYKILTETTNKGGITTDKTDKEILLNATHNIYEVWCLITILNVFINELGWEIKKQLDVKKILNSFLLRNNSIQGFEVELFYQKNSSEYLNLKIVYDKEIFYGGNNKLRPDYKLIFSKSSFRGKKIEKIVYLDAKYRNYNQQGGVRYFKEVDIKKVALEKYFKSFIETEHEPIVSMIIHSSNEYKYVDFGTQKLEVENLGVGLENKLVGHNLGGFPIVPQNKKYLKIFIRMILEYHLKEFEICWECGTSNPQKFIDETEAGFEKYHYTCKVCDEFWVKTHCSNSQCNRDLVKHIENYHRTSKEKGPWYVECPKCSDF